MAVAEAHPSAEELTAFTLGTLDEEAQAPIEIHVASCTSCQERAANTPGDRFVEVLRSTYARTSRGADTFVEAGAQGSRLSPDSLVFPSRGLRRISRLASRLAGACTPTTGIRDMRRKVRGRRWNLVFGGWKRKRSCRSPLRPTSAPDE